MTKLKLFVTPQVVFSVMLALTPSLPVVVEEDADPFVDSTFVLQSVTCQPVLQVVKEFRGDSAPGREEIGQYL